MLCATTRRPCASGARACATGGCGEGVSPAGTASPPGSGLPYDMLFIYGSPTTGGATQGVTYSRSIVFIPGTPWRHSLRTAPRAQALALTVPMLRLGLALCILAVAECIYGPVSDGNARDEATYQLQRTLAVSGSSGHAAVKAQSSSTSTKLHIVSCETRSVHIGGTTARDIRQHSLQPLLLQPHIVLRELCAGKEFRGRDQTMQKIEAVFRYAATLPPDDAIMFTDSDVVFNVGRANITASEVLRRFNLARGRHAVLFQGEPFCFAPTMTHYRRARRNDGAPVLRETAVCTQEKLHLFAQAGSELHHWSCSRFLNSGVYMGYAADISRLTGLWSQPTLWQGGCARRPRFGWADQCIATEMALQGNVSIAVDVHEQLFAPGGDAVPEHPANRGQRLRIGRIGRNASSARCPPCGRTRCDCSVDFVWEHSGEMLGRLQRRPEHRATCKAVGIPLAIHFNGVSKHAMKSPQMADWRKTLPAPSS